MKKLMIMIVMLGSACDNEMPDNSGKVNSKLYAGNGKNRPLIVGFGGSEGGNAWTGARWKTTRNKFIQQGYAFLAIGYFGAKDTPENLDRISIDAIYKAIESASDDPAVDRNRIAVFGGSKGAELALLLASHYPKISCVVAMVPGNCVFPALTFTASTSSWTYKREEVPFVPMPWSAVPSAMKHDLRSAFSIMRENKEAVQRAFIHVENINGPIFFLSATKDEMWPSSDMSDEMMIRLKAAGFPFVYEHLAINGSHTDVLDHFDAVFEFLHRNFPAR